MTVWKERDEYIRLTESINSQEEGQKVTWETVEQQLSRLDSVNSGLPCELDPKKRLSLAAEAIDQSMLSVSEKHSVHWQTVKRAVRDTWAVLAYLCDEPNENLTEEIVKRVELLKSIGAEQRKLEIFSRSPEIAGALKEIPQAGVIFRHYIKYRSVGSLFSPMGIETRQYHDQTLRRFFASTTAEDSMSGFNNLILRYSLADGFEDPNAQRVVSQAAVFLLETSLSSLPKKHADRVRSMRSYLKEMAQQEFEVAKPDFESKTETRLWFPQRSGELDATEMYRRFAASGFCPLSILSYAQMVINDTSKDERVETIKPGQSYSIDWLRNLDWAGVKFLENLFIWRAGQNDEKLTLDIFTTDVSETLRTAKGKYLEREEKKALRKAETEKSRRMQLVEL